MTPYEELQKEEDLTREEIRRKKEIRDKLIMEGIDPDKPAEPKRQEYVVGFRFEGRNVLLLRKNRPAWQSGRLNGVGGKVEPGEHVADAMSREYKEEVGVPVCDWDYRIRLVGTSFVLHVFSSKGEIELPRQKNDVDEDLVLVPFENLPSDVIGNLHWMIPLCLDYGVRGKLVAGPIEMFQD